MIKISITESSPAACRKIAEARINFAGPEGSYNRECSYVITMKDNDGLRKEVKIDKYLMKDGSTWELLEMALAAD